MVWAGILRRRIDWVTGTTCQGPPGTEKETRRPQGGEDLEAQGTRPSQGQVGPLQSLMPQSNVVCSHLKSSPQAPPRLSLMPRALGIQPLTFSVCSPFIAPAVFPGNLDRVLWARGLPSASSRLRVHPTLLRYPTHTPVVIQSKGGHCPCSEDLPRWVKDKT